MILIILICASYISTQDVLYVNKTVDMMYTSYDTYTLLSIDTTTCEGSVLYMKDTTIDMKILYMSNVRYIMISSKRIDRCNEYNWIGCMKSSKYCKIYDNTTIYDMMDRGIDISIDTCMDDVYVYVYPIDTDTKSTVKTYIKQTSRVCSAIEDEYCMRQSYDRCRNNNVDSNCGTIVCIVDNIFYKGYCYSDVSKDVSYGLCNENVEWSMSGNRDIEYTILQPSRTINIMNIILYVIVCTCISICCCSTYYRYRLKYDGFAPFSPPPICPTFLFPIPQYIEDDYASINNGMIPLNIIRSNNN